MKLRLLLPLLLTPLWLSIPPSHAGCYSIIAGKDATADGSVLFGHNEDNAPKFAVGMVPVGRAKHDPGATVKLPSGTPIPQVPETFAYWWLMMPELNYSDTLVNEFGVAVASDNCPSREDNPQITQGGIGGPILRRLVVERARCARDGVKLVGSLVEKFGYTASGRTLVICDANEGWLVSLVNGNHWVAARVPDDQVACIANTYTIQEVDLSNSARFLGSADLIDYAINRGWYDPTTGPFSFEAAYARPGSRRHRSNLRRQSGGLRQLTDQAVNSPTTGRLAFSVKPREPLTVNHLTKALRDHSSGICGRSNNSSSVFQLRAGLPPELRTVWWLTLSQACCTPYIPFYPTSGKVPESCGFGPDSGEFCNFCVQSATFGPTYDLFGKLAKWVSQDYSERIGPVQRRWQQLEETSRQFQVPMETSLRENWSTQSAAAVAEFLHRYSAGTVAQAMQEAQELITATP